MIRLSFVLIVFLLGSLKAQDTLEIKPYTHIEGVAGSETSGIIKSRLYPGIFWVHNDSGDSTRIFPIDSTGAIVKSYRYNRRGGQFIPDAVNMDWEDMTQDDQGNIIIADIGNNCNCRRDMVLYYVRETDPIQMNNSVFKKVFVQYPDQKEFPASKDNFNFDCEGVFYAHGKVYFLSKNRSNTQTKLYRLDSAQTEVMNTLTLIDRFDTQGMVTGADVSKDGKTLAVLTYKGVYIFEAEEKEKWFQGNVRHLPLKMVQAEGICFDGDEVVITDEFEGRIYRLKMDQIK
jgi:hypothetical protein